MTERIENHPGVLSMLQALASEPHAFAPGAVTGIAERAIGLIEALLAERATYEPVDPSPDISPSSPVDG